MPANKSSAISKSSTNRGGLSRFQKFEAITIARGEIRNAAYNPRKIGANERKKLKEALAELGLVETLVWNGRTKNLVGGHQRLAILDELEGSANYKLTVARIDVAPAGERKLNLLLNNACAQGEWDPGKLQALIAEMEGDIAGTGFDQKELDDILADVTGEKDVDAEPRLEEAERLVKKYGVKPGQLWELGAHRLLCGDSTKADDVKRLMRSDKAGLMNTDPPYGVTLNLKNTHEASNAAKGIKKKYRQFTEIENDTLDGAELQAFLEAAIKAAVPHLQKHAAFYLWHPMLTQGTFFAAAAAADILIHRQIIWVKPHFIFGRGDYHWRHELCFYGWVRGSRPPFYGEGGGSIRKDQNHPTQKPVELFKRPILNHTRAGAICYEPFCGSGSQIMACEGLGRKCYAIEIEPKYVAVSLERWAEATGGRPKLVK